VCVCVCMYVCVYIYRERSRGPSIILFCFLGGKFGDQSVKFMLIISICHTLFHQCNLFHFFIFPNLDTNRMCCSCIWLYSGRSTKECKEKIYTLQLQFYILWGPLKSGVISGKL